MKIDVYLDSKKGLFSAKGVYDDGNVIVKTGSRINKTFAEKMAGKEDIVTIRNNKSIVDDKGIILVDCIFKSPSTAANFVTGRSANGYVAWRVDNACSLGKYLGREKKGSKDTY